MGMKKVGLASTTSSCLTALKNAFWSSSKKQDNGGSSTTRNNENKKSNRRIDENGLEHHQQEKKKREKRRWLFCKSVSHRQCEASVSVKKQDNLLNAEQRHAVAVAAATAATAEAAAATALAAVEIVRLTGSCSFLKEHAAIVVVQTAFRGFLPDSDQATAAPVKKEGAALNCVALLVEEGGDDQSTVVSLKQDWLLHDVVSFKSNLYSAPTINDARKALRALKGLVKLQALVRGQNVRRQAKMTLQCMQALVRVQDQMRDQAVRLSYEGARRSSMSAGNYSSRDSKFHEDVSESRRTISGDGSGYLDNWDVRSRTLDEIDKMLQSRKEALMEREKALACAFSQQVERSRSRRNISLGNESEVDDGAKWLHTWMAAKQWQNNSVKSVEVSASRPHVLHMVRSPQQTNHQRPASPQRVSSPRRPTHNFSFNYQSPATPSTPKIRPLQVRSASPWYFKEEKSYSTTHTPTFGSAYRLNADPLDEKHRNASDVATLPNYMTATESAKAKARSQSAPRTRPPTPERERSCGSVKKRLSYQPEEHLARAGATPRCCGTSLDLRSPSFKRFYDFSYGLEQQSNLSSYYTDSVAEEISPCSTTDLGRWLR